MRKDVGPAEIRLVGGFGVMDHLGRKIDTRAVLAEIRAASGRDLLVLIDSDGGLVDAARQIYAALQQHPRDVVCRVIGRCSSAATLPLLAGRFREAVSTAQIMIHTAAVDTSGERWTAAKHRAVAQEIDKTNREIRALYERSTKMRADWLDKEMAHERPMTLDMAQLGGFIHAVVGRRPYYPQGQTGKRSSRR
jgi:ATP-dependent protease ClpP protease subunit